MKNIHVSLLHCTPINVLTKAVGMPYNNPKSSIKLAEKVIKVLKHESVAEHVNFNFIIEGSSRLELQEHMRHRIASPTVKSTRYTLDDFLNEAEIDISIARKYFVMQEDLILRNLQFAHIVDSHRYMQDLKDAGFSNDKIKYLLPEGFRTSFAWTINMRSLFNFLDLRLDKNAHLEIKHVGGLILNAVMETNYKAFFRSYVDEEV